MKIIRFQSTPEIDKRRARYLLSVGSRVGARCETPPVCSICGKPGVLFSDGTGSGIFHSSCRYTRDTRPESAK